MTTAEWLLRRTRGEVIKDSRGRHYIKAHAGGKRKPRDGRNHWYGAYFDGKVWHASNRLHPMECMPRGPFEIVYTPASEAQHG